MGNQPTATRRVTFEREQAGVIAISDSVAKRLRSGEAPSHSKQHGEPSHSQAPETSSSSGKTKNDTTTRTAASSSGMQSDGMVWNTDQPSGEQRGFIAQGLMQERMQGDYNQMLRQLEDDWQERYKRLETDSEHVRKTSGEELHRSLKNVESMFATKSQNVISSDLQQAVMECYKQNTTRTLNCSQEADAFIRGVETFKTNFLGKQMS
ncbi:MICOS complex subunit mic25-a-like [Paramacrobiotus metropolitanus]|uniref:MICOS complex subunit mic25-a-like n=1 Tax=Paramacrobiotus metropolitanus TaxID=2943436 RepID=UPI002445B42B|nr:MICOS complex subunit mic25-a-like [Paramacrobiotus metropolitanus]